ncbi:hypothetical protein L6R29_25385 [Myxococcota bacterium]|nr:hypothetical protein [Myxococcota bacterium]
MRIPMSRPASSVLLLLCLCFSASCYLDAQLQRTNPYDDKYQGPATCKADEDCAPYATCLGTVCSSSKLNQKPECSAKPNEPCVISGIYNRDIRLTADTTWLLRGNVIFGDDQTPVTLRIDPGTKILADPSTRATLHIARNARILAEGTREKPIFFSSASPSPRAGDWGGLLLNGNAPQNHCTASTSPCQNYASHGGRFGGDKPEDNSGILRYVRIEYAGATPTTNAALSLRSVGSQTTIEFVRLHASSADGLSITGGNAQLKRILITNAAQNGLAWTDGWRGKAQFLLIYQNVPSTNALEGRNGPLPKENAPLPRAQPTLANVSLHTLPTLGNIGITLREGTGAILYHFLVSGFKQACLSIPDLETYQNAWENGKLTNRLILSHSIFSCSALFAPSPPNAPFSLQDFFGSLNPSNSSVGLILPSATALQQLDFRPPKESPARKGPFAQIDDTFFTKTDYLGAMGPDDFWTQEWATAPLPK